MQVMLRIVISTVLFFHFSIMLAYAQEQTSAQAKGASAHSSSNPVKSIRQGYNPKLWMNNQLIVGARALANGSPFDGEPAPSEVGFEYPVGSGVDHIYGAGPLIGGIINGVRYVSEAYNTNTGTGYFAPSKKDSLRNTIWRTSTSDTAYDPSRIGYYKKPPSKRETDDDGDGNTDEDELDGEDNDGDWVRATDDLGADGMPDILERGCKGAYDPVINKDPAFDNYGTLRDSCRYDPVTRTYPMKNDRNRYTQGNGIPDHGEPHVDEDYSAYSESDIYIVATDTNESPDFPNHKKMNIRVLMKSYAWQSSLRGMILPVEYVFKNIGRVTIKDPYLGFKVAPDIRPVTLEHTNNYSGFIDSLRSAYTKNPDVAIATPFALTLLNASKPFDELKIGFQWFDTGSECVSYIDSVLYGCLICESNPGTGCIWQGESPASKNGYILSVGPFDDLTPGKEIRLSVAWIIGVGMDYSSQSLVSNIKRALYDTRIIDAPLNIYSPCLEVTTDSGFSVLRWGKLKPGCYDPREAWDDSSKLAYLEDWRRANPPPGKTKGGRVLEGFRVYRTEDPFGDVNSFALLHQFDYVDRYGYNVGLDTFFIDRNVRSGRTYWYAVTSFSIPQYSYFSYNSPTRGYVLDTLYGESQESHILENAQKAYIRFSSPSQLGQVKVVPNPYLGDEYYTDGRGYEGLESEWHPGKRVVRFIHLPPKATIRIFTIAGDVVHTIYHDDQTGTPGQADFRLASEANRPLAPGVFVYSVESEYGTEVGKFVIIK